MAGGRAWGRWQRLDEVVHRRGTAAKLVPPTTALEPRRLSLQWHRYADSRRQGAWRRPGLLDSRGSPS